MYLCDKCSKQFEQTPRGKQEWLAHRTSHSMREPDMGIPDVTATEIATRSMSAAEIRADKAKPKKVTLTYKWEGECSDCGNKVETITIDAGQPKGKTIAVAFCSVCHKELAYRPVEKL